MKNWKLQKLIKEGHSPIQVLIMDKIIKEQTLKNTLTTEQYLRYKQMRHKSVANCRNLPVIFG